MAQVVIFAPPGEDVSAGETALKDAGHEVEIVEASPENLLHMAIGMLEGTGGTDGSGKSDEEGGEELPAEEDVPAEEPAPEEEVTEEGLTVNDETIPVSVSPTAKFSLLRAINVSGQDRVSYSINESRFTFWDNLDGAGTPVTVANKKGSAWTVKVQVKEGKKPGLVLCKADAKRMRLA